MCSSDLRLDKWLFYARVLKSRSLAAELILSGHVRVNGQRATAAHRKVRPGDVLTIALERQVLVYRLRATAERRGPATEAQSLYEVIG